jgi:O-antigen/teichoic acid export membrane protein
LNIRESAIKAVFWTVTQRWGRQLVNLILIIILSRYLKASEFGLVALAGSFIDFLTIFIDQGFSTAIIQFENLDEKHLSTAFWVNIVISTVLTLASFALAGVVAYNFQEARLELVLKVLSFQIILEALVTTQIAILRRDLQFRALAVRGLVSTSAGALAGIGIAVAGFGVWALVARSLVAAVVDILVLWSASVWRPRLVFSLKHLREMFSFGINMLGTDIVEYVRENIDNLLIGYVLGTTLLGYYAIAYKLIDVLDKVFIGIFRSVSLPVFARLQSERERLTKAFFEATQVTSVISLAAYMGVFLLTEPIVLILYGPDWLVTVSIIRWLSVIGMIRTLFTFNESMLVAMGRPDWHFLTVLLDGLASTLGIILGLKFGIIGVAIGRSIASSLVTPVPIFLIIHLLQQQIDTYLKILRPAVFATAMMCAFVWATNSLMAGAHAWIALITSTIIGAAAFIGYLYICEQDLFRKLVALIQAVIPAKITRLSSKG